MTEKKRRITGSSVARIAGNILSGIAANPGWSNKWPDEEDADVVFRLALYIAKKAEAYDEENIGGMR